MKNNVQAYIAVVSFCTTLEELKYLTENNYYMDMELIMLFDEVDYTSPKWAAKGDIVFFYHAKSAITKIRHLRSLAIKENNKYKKEYDRFMEYLNTAEMIYEKCGGSIFSVGKVSGKPEVEENETRENLHWKSNIYAPIDNITFLNRPILKSEFEQFVKLSAQQTITPVLGEDFENLKNLILKYNDVSFIENCQASPISLKEISNSNWIRISQEYRRKFYLEIQFRKFYVDYFLKSIGDRKIIYSECTCIKSGKRTGYVDNVIVLKGKYIPVEIKLNINAEKSLTKQLNKYCNVDQIKLGKSIIEKNNILQDKVVLIDTDGIYIYYFNDKSIHLVKNLDNIKCDYDIRKLKAKLIHIMEE